MHASSTVSWPERQNGAAGIWQERVLKTPSPRMHHDYTSLSTLTLLDLSSNHLTGALPPIGSLTGLQTLELMENSLTGPLPDLAGAQEFDCGQFSG